MEKREADNLTFLDFLTKNKPVSSHNLMVASFQRNYKWGRTRLLDFVDSIEENEKSYYLGNVVTQVGANRDKGYREDFIIDGQQRLITLSLIIFGLNKHVSAKNKKIINKILYYDGNVDIPRITFFRENLQKVYLKILNNKVGIKPGDESQKKILNNYRLIQKRLLRIPDLDEFFEKIISLEFVIIQCPSAHDVHQLFESLNSKNEKLSVVELVKNSFLWKAERSKVVLKIWEEMEKMFEKKNLVWFDKFMRHRWFYEGGYISNSKLYDSINKSVKKQPDICEYSKLLKKDAEIYLKLRNPEEIVKRDFSGAMESSAWKKLNMLLLAIDKMKLEQIYPVLFALVKYGKDNNEYFKRDKLFNDVEIVFYYFLLIINSKNSPSSNEKAFATFCYNLDKSNYKEKRKTLFSSMLKSVPSEEEFTKNINNNILCSWKYDKKVAWKNDRDFLRLLLIIYLSDGKEILSVDLYIEHIIPKSGALKKWKNINETYLDKILETSRFKFGNITLLREDDLGDNDFDYKVEKGYSVSRFLPNKKLAIEFGDMFNSADPSAAVEERGKVIAANIYNHVLTKMKNNLI